MGNTIAAQRANLLNDEFLPGDQVRIIEDQCKISDCIFFVNSVAIDDQSELEKYTSKDPAQQHKPLPVKHAVVVEDDEKKVVGVFQPQQLLSIPNEKNKRRRVEWHLLRNYYEICKAKKISPFENILVSFTEHIRQGIPVFKLELPNTNLGDDDLIAISELFKGDSAIRKVDFSNNKFGHAGCKVFCSTIAKKDHVRELDLSNNNLEFKGASYVGKLLEASNSLAILNLASTKIGATGCDLVIEGCLKNPNTTLARIDLRKNNASDKEVSLLWKLAKQVKSLCIAELYPPSDSEEYNLEQSKDIDVMNAWLSYEGWKEYGNLHSTLLKNKEFVEGNPDLLKPKIPIIRSAEDAYEYLLYSLSSMKTFSEDNPQNQQRKRTFDEWKKNRQIENEWKQLTKEQQRLLSMENQLKKDHMVKQNVSAELSDNLVVGILGDPLVDEPKQDVTPETTPKNLEDEAELDWIVLDDEFGNVDHTPHYKEAKKQRSPLIVDPSISKSPPKQSMNKSMVEVLHDEQDANTISNILDEIKKTKGDANSSIVVNMNCTICLETKPSSDFYILDECYHKFCIECLRNYVVIKIKNFEADAITCPQCNMTISPNQIKQLLMQKTGNESDDLLEKFEKCTLKKALLSMKNLVWCPNRNCSNAMVVDANRNSIQQLAEQQQQPMSNDAPQQVAQLITCTECKTKICTLCKSEYHSEYPSCEEYAQTKKKMEQETHQKNEQLSQKYFEENMVKQCPNCNIAIQKVKHTCNEVKCKHCNTVFCFYCGESITNTREHFATKKCARYNMLHDLNPFVD